MEIKQNLLEESKYNLKCPYEMIPKFIIVHNTYNDAPAKNEIAYMVRNDSSTSFHIAVDDVEAIQGIPFNQNSWNCGDGRNGNGNRNGISIEICYSKSGGERWEKAKTNAVELIAQLLKQYGWGIEQVKKHQDFSNKYCPHRILDEGWEGFLNLIREKLGQTVVKKPNVQTKPSNDYEVFVGEVQKACGLTGENIDYIAGPVTLKHTITVSSKTNRCHVVVTALERYLKILGYYSGKIEADFGEKPTFGSGMTTAVKNYQKDNGCKIDGEITARNKTWKKLLKLA